MTKDIKELTEKMFTKLVKEHQKEEVTTYSLLSQVSDVNEFSKFDLLEIDRNFRHLVYLKGYTLDSGNHANTITGASYNIPYYCVKNKLDLEEHLKKLNI